MCKYYIGIDPGYDGLGYAVFDKTHKFITGGVISPPVKDFDIRIAYISNILKTKLKKYLAESFVFLEFTQARINVYNFNIFARLSFATGYYFCMLSSATQRIKLLGPSSWQKVRAASGTKQLNHDHYMGLLTTKQQSAILKIKGKYAADEADDFMDAVCIALYGTEYGE